MPIIPKSVAALRLATLLVAAGVASASGARGTQSSLPADVDAESRSRLATPAPHPAGGPAAAIRDAGMGLNARWESPVGRPLLQLAILITAREHDAPFEWPLHEMEAVAVDLEPAVIDVVRNREPLTELRNREAVIIQAGREIYGDHRLSPQTYRRAVELFGEANCVEVVDLMARYAGTAARLASFNQQMPSGWPQFLPLPFTPPDDVDPQSRSRLPPLPAPAEQLRSTPSLYARTLSPHGTGPGQIASHGAGPESLEANVARPLLDLAILVTARAYDDQYTSTLTEPAAVQNALDPAVIHVVREGGPVAALGEKEAALITFGAEPFAPHTVSPATYASAVEAVGGATNLLDLVNLMAHQVSDAILLIAFDQQPAGAGGAAAVEPLSSLATCSINATTAPSVGDPSPIRWQAGVAIADLHSAIRDVQWCGWPRPRACPSAGLSPNAWVRLINNDSSTTMVKAKTMRPSPTPVLECRNLTKSFWSFQSGARVEVLRGLSCLVYSAEVVAVVGSSGSGKTTLLRLLAGLSQPDTGVVLVNGELVDSPGNDRVLLLQESTLLPWRTVAQNVALGFPKLCKEKTAVVYDALEQVGLDGLADRWPRELSGGEQRRVELARSLAASPAVLLLDEPFTSLDAVRRIALHKQVRDLWQSRAQTVFLVTHDLQEAVSLGDRILLLSKRAKCVVQDWQVQDSQRQDSAWTSQFIEELKTALYHCS